jgi:hypothetical protein
MSDPLLIELSPHRPDIFIDLRKRPRDPTAIVTDVLLDLKAYMQDPAKGTFPKTIIWTRSLNDLARFKRLTRTTLGRLEYYPSADPPYGRRWHFSNQAVCLYFADQDLGIKDHVLKQLLDPSGTVLLIFASTALSTGVNVAAFLHSIHIGLPSKLVHLYQSIGRIGRGVAGLSVAIIYANGVDVARHANKKKDTERQLRIFAKCVCACRGAVCSCVCVRKRLLTPFMLAYNRDLPVGHPCCSACVAAAQSDDIDEKEDDNEEPWSSSEFRCT